MEIDKDKLYQLKGEKQLLKLKKVETHGIHIFWKCDENGKVKSDNSDLILLSK